MSKFYNVATAS